MSRKINISKRQEQYIREHYKHILKVDMAKHLKLHKDVVGRYCRANRLNMSKAVFFKLRAQKMIKPFTRLEDSYIKNNIEKIGVKAIAKELGRTGSYVSRRAKELGLSDLIYNHMLNVRFKPGNIPFNKGKKMTPEQYKKAKHTFFKKGHLPANTAERDGVIRVRKDNSGREYKYIRLGLGVWELYHKYRWELFRGKIPNGYCLWFKDRNPLNCLLPNLELITRAENLRRNRDEYLSLPPDVRRLSRVLNKLNSSISGKTKSIKKLKSTINGTKQAKRSK